MLRGLALIALLSGCHHKELTDAEANALLSGAHVIGFNRVGDFERIYGDDAFVQTGDTPGRAHWATWAGKLCTTWKEGGPPGTRCDHLMTDQRGLYWIERRSNAQTQGHTTTGRPSRSSLASSSSTIATFTLIEDQASSEDRRHIQPFFDVYKYWFMALASVLFLWVLVFKVGAGPKEEPADPSPS